jgi:hypothetical protein
MEFPGIIGQSLLFCPEKDKQDNRTFYSGLAVVCRHNEALMLDMETFIVDICHGDSDE